MPTKSETIIYENYYKRTGFSKEEICCSLKRLKSKRLLLLANKFKKYAPDPCNAKEQYESFWRKKKRESVKPSEIITYKPKIFDTVDIKSDITEHPKTSHKSSKTIRKGEKVDSN